MEKRQKKEEKLKKMEGESTKEKPKFFPAKKPNLLLFFFFPLSFAHFFSLSFLTMEPLEQTSYDVVVLGTGITESIIAAQVFFFFFFSLISFLFITLSSFLFSFLF